MRGRSTTGTRSPIQRVPIIEGGCAQTLKLYGIMKYSAMPVAEDSVNQLLEVRELGLPPFFWASSCARCAVTTPSTHRRTASRGSSRTLFWNG
jgi:hypothetical protein